jgi:phenylacetate-CoA ligase
MAILTKLIFFAFDAKSGFEVTKLYKEATEANETERPFDPARIQRYLQDWGIKGSLADQPLMGKPEVKEYIKNLDTGKVHAFAYTGGSYGQPLKIPYSKRRGFIRTSTVRYFNERAGYHLGDKFMFIRAKPKPKWLQKVRNEVLFIPNDLTAGRIDTLLAQMDRENVECIIGYPTVMYELALAHAREGKKRKLALRSLLSVSEPLDDAKRKFIHDTFNCQFIDRYANEEVGVIAQQKEFGGEYYVERFGVVVEVLHPETLKPVATGEEGKVIVTDLNADLIPMVRYDTGDNAIAGEYRNGQLWTIRKVSGRTSEIMFNTSGAPISSLILGPHIHMPLTETGLNSQFQFAQVAPKKYVLRLKAPKDKMPQTALDQVAQNVKSVMGQDAEIEFVFVDDIAPLPSGKRPIYKNEMEKK